MTLFRAMIMLKVGFTITSLNDLPKWEFRALGNTRRIAALKKAHDLGIKTFVSMEPTIPEETSANFMTEK